jgi:hypothetical protein
VARTARGSGWGEGETAGRRRERNAAGGVRWWVSGPISHGVGGWVSVLCWAEGRFGMEYSKDEMDMFLPLAASKLKSAPNPFTSSTLSPPSPRPPLPALAPASAKPLLASGPPGRRLVTVDVWVCGCWQGHAGSGTRAEGGRAHSRSGARPAPPSSTRPGLAPNLPTTSS